jgi:glucosylceramidase
MNMTKLISAGLTTMLVACAPVIPNDPQPDPEKRFEITSPVEVYLSTVDQTHLFSKVEDATVFVKGQAPTSGFDVRINPNITYQTIVGSGASFTDASAYLINQVLSNEDRDDLMIKLFDREEGIGLSFVRQPMGASDFARDFYTYNDMPKGQTDETLQNFSIDHDRTDIIPLLQQALRINPDLKIMASPWSAPGWMKTTDSTVGGQLKPQYYPVYGEYFAKFIEAYKSEGIDIYAITPQNEPLYVPVHYPGLGMNAQQQTNFIKNGLVPAFQKAGIETKILVYDHNWDRKDYPLDILKSIPDLVDGVAWHVYGGQVTAMSEVKREFPDHDVYFTEASGGEWVPPFEQAFLGEIKTGIDVFRNHSKTYVLWNFALDENNGPVVPGFGRSTVRGMVTVNQQTGELIYNLDYYALAHFSKFTQPDAIRIDSTKAEGNFTSVAFLNPDQTVCLVVYNISNQSRNALIHLDDQTIVIPMVGKAVATVTFSIQEKPE